MICSSDDKTLELGQCYSLKKYMEDCTEYYLNKQLVNIWNLAICYYIGWKYYIDSVSCYIFWATNNILFVSGGDNNALDKTH